MDPNSASLAHQPQAEGEPPPTHHKFPLLSSPVMAAGARVSCMFRKDEELPDTDRRLGLDRCLAAMDPSLRKQPRCFFSQWSQHEHVIPARDTFRAASSGRRPVHVYVFWFSALGLHYPFGDDLLLKSRRILENTCDSGVEKETGHKRSKGVTCCNPFHYACTDCTAAHRLLVADIQNLLAHHFCSDPFFKHLLELSCAAVDLVDLIRFIREHCPPIRAREHSVHYAKFPAPLSSRSLELLFPQRMAERRAGSDVLACLASCAPVKRDEGASADVSMFCASLQPFPHPSLQAHLEYSPFPEQYDGESRLPFLLKSTDLHDSSAYLEYELPSSLFIDDSHSIDGSLSIAATDPGYPQVWHSLSTVEPAGSCTEDIARTPLMGLLPFADAHLRKIAALPCPVEQASSTASSDDASSSWLDAEFLPTDTHLDTT